MYFLIVGVIVLIIAKLISIMHDWRCNGSSAGVEFCWLLPYMYGAVSLESWTNCARMLQLTVFGR